MVERNFLNNPGVPLSNGSICSSNTACTKIKCNWVHRKSTLHLLLFNTCAKNVFLNYLIHLVEENKKIYLIFNYLLDKEEGKKLREKIEKEVVEEVDETKMIRHRKNYQMY